MNCLEVQRLLQPYSDRELDLVRQLEIEWHLGECADCAARDERLRSLRGALSSPDLYHRAPASLRARVRAAAAPATGGGRGWTPRRVAIAAGILFLIGGAVTIGSFVSGRPAGDDRLAERVVAGHVRSLQVEHLTDVASSDRHTVKPWFRGKLDFAPQVPDLTRRGYPLRGGRLDYLTDRPVAALVYHRRLHVINVFTWPAVDEEESAVRASSRQGFSLRTWQRDGMIYWASSDLNDEEFDEFVRLFREAARTPSP